MKSLHQIIKRPLITEKTTEAKDADQVVTFEVARDANKREIKQAVEKAFDVQVIKVSTAIIPGKVKRFGYHMGKRSNKKKAYVTLSPNSEIDFFEV